LGNRMSSRDSQEGDLESVHSVLVGKKGENDFSIVQADYFITRREEENQPGRSQGPNAVGDETKKKRAISKKKKTEEEGGVWRNNVDATRGIGFWAQGGLEILGLEKAPGGKGNRNRRK